MKSGKINSPGRWPARLLMTVMAAPAGTPVVACAADKANGATAPDAGFDDGDASSSSYADGEYRATGWYGGLPSSIGVAVTLKDTVLTTVAVTPNATDPTSLDYQRRFAAAVPSVVVGKRIDEVNVGRLAGSSGTPIGFNDALRQIKERARRP